MIQLTAQHQLGQFIVSFQHAEAALTEMLVLMFDADDEAVRILVSELEYSKRVRATDVMFARFADLHLSLDETAKTDFHKLMEDLLKLGERRNAIVHSKYTPWINTEGSHGLIRENSKLKSKKGIRECEEEELLPEAFAADFSHLTLALRTLEGFRLRIIDTLYPVEG